MSRSTTRVLRAAACALLVHAVAHAAPEGPQSAERVRARTLYGQGEKLLKAGDVAGAERAFEEAYTTLPNAAVLLKIADCKVKLNDYPGAVESLEKYLVEKKDPPDRAAVEDRIAEMRRKPGTLSVHSAPGGAAIWVDGQDSALVTPSDVELPPGEHKLQLKLPPYQPVEQTVVVEFGSKKDLELKLEEPAPAATQSPVTSPASTLPPEDTASGPWHPNAGFWIAVGATAAGAAVTTVFGVIALNKHSDYEKHPTTALADDGERAALISDVGLCVAAAGAVTATVLFFTTGRKKHSDQGFTVGPMVGRGGGGLVGHASF